MFEWLGCSHGIPKQWLWKLDDNVLRIGLKWRFWWVVREWVWPGVNVLGHFFCTLLSDGNFACSRQWWGRRPIYNKALLVKWGHRGLTAQHLCFFGHTTACSSVAVTARSSVAVTACSSVAMTACSSVAVTTCSSVAVIAFTASHDEIPRFQAPNISPYYWQPRIRIPLEDSQLGFCIEKLAS